MRLICIEKALNKMSMVIIAGIGKALFFFFVTNIQIAVSLGTLKPMYPSLI